MIYLILGLKHETLQLDSPCLLRDFLLPMPLTPNPCLLRDFLLPMPLTPNPCLLRDFLLPMSLTPNPCLLRGFLLPNAANFITGLSLLLTAGDLL